VNDFLITGASTSDSNQDGKWNLWIGLGLRQPAEPVFFVLWR
jgi:hypothetical protein